MTRALSIALLLIVTAAALLAFDASRRKSACYDEPKHLVVGAALLDSGHFVGDDNTPIVALHALPLLGRDLDRTSLPTRTTSKTVFEDGAAFLRANGVVQTLRPARAVSIVLFVLLLVLLARLTVERSGYLGALLAVGLCAFDPTLLGHAAILSADLPLATATLFVLLAWRRCVATPTAGSTVLLALALGLALLAKLNGVIVVAVLGLDAILGVRRETGPRVLARLSQATAIAFALVFLAYFDDPLAYLRGLERVANYGAGALPQYFDGALGARSILFYPAVLAFKLPIGTVLAIVTFVLAYPRLKRHGLLPERTTVLLLLAFGLAPIASGYQQGIRFLLPVLPLLALLCAPLGALATGPLARVGIVALVLSNLATTWLQHPHHLAYWNIFAGGSGRGDRWFVDSNDDWGQDLTTLARLVESERVDRLYLAAYGSVPPADYGLEFVNLFDGPRALTAPVAGERTLLAISDTVFRFVLAGGTERNDPLLPIVAQIADTPPDFHVGYTIRAYWVTPELLARFTESR